MGQPFGTPLEAITVLFGPHGLIRVPAALTIVITGTVRRFCYLITLEGTALEAFAIDTIRS